MMYNKVKFFIISLLNIVRINCDHLQEVEYLIRTARDQKSNVLDLSSKNIETLPLEVCELENLEKLILHSNKLISLPDQIKSLVNLKNLNISGNKLNLLQNDVQNLKKLETLDISNNELVSLPNEIGGLYNLRYLDVSSNMLNSLPNEIGNLTNLEFLDISANKLTMLVNEIGNLANIKSFNISNNQFYLLPREIGNLFNMEYLYLSNNELLLLPDEIGRLTSLKRLYANNNQLKFLPDGIGNLLNLEYLNIFSNQLTLLTNQIGKLKNLKKLDVSSNMLIFLSNEIGNLGSLEKLFLSKNQLRSLPRQIERLSINPNFILKIEDNPLVDNGHGELGALELHKIFGDRVILSEILRNVLIQELYQRMFVNQNINWNIDTIKMIKLEKVAKSNMSFKEMLCIWQEHLSKYQDQPNDQLIKEYIEVLYGMRADVFENVIWHLDSLKALKNLIEAIFVKLRDNILSSVEGVEDDARSYISEIFEAIHYCTDRQYATLNMLYSALYNKKYTSGSFENLIRNYIAIIKNNVFERIVTPGEGIQNVHTQNYWKYKLREEIGFEIDYSTDIRILSISVFDNDPLKVIEAFYNEFTPDYVIKELSKITKQDKKFLIGSGGFIGSRMEEEDDIDLYFDFENEYKRIYIDPSLIKYEGIKKILLDMDILKINDSIKKG